MDSQSNRIGDYMAWDGIERREDRGESGFCKAHIELTNTMAAMSVSLKNIEKTITEGVTFRTGVIIATIGIVVAIVTQVVIFSYLYGGLNNQVAVNTGRLNVIENMVKK